MQRREFLAGSLTAATAGALSSGGWAAGDPPNPHREFRGVWLATVANIDWPSRPGLPVTQQKAELLSLLDRTAALKMNAVLFQVRPACDALYDSRIEPWSDFLTGTMGRAPDPYYDPLQFVVEEAHRRGLELHAWFNPYRAHHHASKGPISPSHVSRTRPRLVRRYGGFLWLDPGEEAVKEYSLGVVRDVVRRYDIDGVHIDDYFYPYKEKDRSGQVVPFPDEASWAKYRAGGGRLTRDDWRRHNVDDFVERLYGAVKAEKKWVKVGISPFGIWRPGHPAQIQGFDAYQEIYCDSRKWLRSGWLDYITPQLYWRMDAHAQSYPALLQWWAGENEKNRHLWAGNDAERVTAGRWPVEEIAGQVRVTREQQGASGNVFFSARPLLGSRSLTGSLGTLYQEPALVPATPWLAQGEPAKPKVERRGRRPETVVWRPGDEEPVRWWVVQFRSGERWSTEVLPGDRTSWSLDGATAGADRVRISGVDRNGIRGPHAEMRLAG